MKDSVIWKDAKDMHTTLPHFPTVATCHLEFVQRTYDKLAPLVGADNESDDDNERVQKGIAHWDKQNHAVPAPNCMLKVRGEIIKNEGL